MITWMLEMTPTWPRQRPSSSLVTNTYTKTFLPRCAKTGDADENEQARMGPEIAMQGWDFGADGPRCVLDAE